MKYLHTMLRVRNLDDALHFYVDLLGLKEVRRRVDEKNKYTLVFLAAPDDMGLVEESKKSGRDQPLVELTYNWNTEDYGEARYFGHLAYEVEDIYATCEKLMKGGVTINRPPRDGNMAFVRSPDKQSIELLQKGAPCRRRSRGPRCRIPGIGEAAVSPPKRDGDKAGLPAEAQRRRVAPCPPSSLYLAPLRGLARIPRPSSSGPGHRPFTAVTRVRVP